MSTATLAEKTFIAHAAHTSDGGFTIHSLEDHLLSVGDLARRFGNVFGNGDWAYTAGVWHDLGKYRPEFQSYIRTVTGYDPEAHLEGYPGRVDHSTAGAIHAMNELGARGRIVAYLIAGHHAGLPDWLSAEAGGSSLAQRLEKKDLLASALSQSPPSEVLKIQKPESKPKGRSPALWIRMLFSCLVDADFLDTESFMDKAKALTRGVQGTGITELLPVLEAHLAKLVESAKPSQVNTIRSEILKQCQQQATSGPGIFSLTVPTGGGKTLSSMAFALKHASIHGKDRVIYVIPYTSIIEQTANTLRTIFGDEVVEHHSNLDPERETPQSRLACENWDAPIVVTTSVQFFESLFAARTSRVRKVHNIANSVVILDEAQLLPPDFLLPILDSIRELALAYGVTVLLSTATQPALEPRKGLDFKFDGLHGVKEIVSNPTELHEKLRRVRVEVPNDLSARRSWEEISKELLVHQQVLCIVNSRDDCLSLFKLMPKGTIHLSALMCGAHRSEIISTIKEKLKSDEILRVVSTQLVEAGVDIDFPVVYRALAGLDSIAQAAGRCNREGLLPAGKFVLFVPPRSSPPGHLRQAEQCGRQILRKENPDPLSPDCFKQYFQQLYWQKGDQLDKEGIRAMLSGGADLEILFRSAAARFKIIDENAQAPVLVRYGKSDELIDMLLRLGPSRWLMRRLQRYVVNIPRKLHAHLVKDGDVVEASPGIFIQAHHGLYHPDTGLSATDPTFHDPESLVI